MLVSLIVLALLSACTDSSQSTTPTTAGQGVDAAQPGPAEVLVGEVDGGKGLIAVVSAADGVTIYVCGFDDHLDTHTGWFFGTPSRDGDALVVPELSSAGDLKVGGRINGDDARGTLTLGSGDQVDWSAHKVSGNGAGLYAADDAASLAGLIVNEDDRMVGSASLRLGAPAGATATPTPTTIRTNSSTTTTTASPSTVAAPSSPSIVTTRITPPSIRPTGSPTTVTFPITPTTTTTKTLTPISTPRVVTKSGPAIVFLVHGMSDNLTAFLNPAQPDPVACNGPPDTPFYGRCEWGPDAIPGLFGAAPGAQLSNLAGDDVTGNRFITSAVGAPLIDETVGVPTGADGCATDPNAAERPDPRTAVHFIAPPQPSRATTVPVPVPPKMSVFTTWRDSTTGVVASGRRLARQAYAATRWWEETYKQTPQIIFVVQSFGGIATRFVMSNPSDASIAALNPDRVNLCPEDHAKMDYLRNRTIFVNTLSTPHEGSFLAEVGEQAKAPLRDALQDLNAGTTTAPLTQVIAKLDDIVHRADPSLPSVRATAQAAIENLQSYLNTPALRDLQFAVMQRWNVGPLSPENARRTRASPIVGAANQLIPIYAAMARTPGSIAFNSPLILDGLKRWGQMKPKEQFWVIQTSLISEEIVTVGSPVDWGAIDGPLAPFADILDRRARLADIQPMVQAVLGAPNAYFRGTFGAGADGVLAYLASINADPLLPTAEIPIYLDRVWKLDMSGSVEVPMIALTCGANRIVIDYEPLVQALLTGANRTSEVLTALGSGDLAAALVAAGASTTDAAGLARDTMTWFQGKVRQLGTAVGDTCRVPTDPNAVVADFFALANVANWHIGATTGTVPAPAWVKTDTVARDGEQDTDGAVHAASALGLQLGREPFFFEHDRGGSWYRLPNEDALAGFNHGLQYQNATGRWVHDRLFVTAVGPVPQATGDSIWPA